MTRPAPPVPLAREIAAAFAGRALRDDLRRRRQSRRRPWPSCAALMAELPALRVLAPRHQRRPEPGGAHRRAGGARRHRGHPGRRRPEPAARCAAAGRRPAGRPAPASPWSAASRQSARIPRPSAGPRAGPTASASSCWATTPTTPAAASRPSAATSSCGLPYFDHIHRYLPALMIREGYENRYLDVDHRHRETGQSKYTNWGRLMASFSDLLGVMWLKTRSRRPGPVTRVLTLACSGERGVAVWSEREYPSLTSCAVRPPRGPRPC